MLALEGADKTVPEQQAPEFKFGILMLPLNEFYDPYRIVSSGKKTWPICKKRDGMSRKKFEIFFL